jgi:hypothetical protein
MASSHGDLGHLLPLSYKRLITSWLEEDCPSFDYGGFVVGESEGEARLLGKSMVSHDTAYLYRFLVLTAPGSHRRSAVLQRSVLAARLHVSARDPSDI